LELEELVLPVTHHLELKVEYQQYLFPQLLHLLEVEVVEVTLIHPFLQTNVEKMEDLLVEVLGQVMEVQEILPLQVHHKVMMVVMEMEMVIIVMELLVVAVVVPQLLELMV
tara:strand:- start:121 stop:453 length:333 start_codon:yes stop_codon:yes gene_type:complete